MARLAAALASLGLLLVASPAGARPARDAPIRPGVGIGRVELGMPLTEVRAALGRPGAVVRRIELAFGGEYVELQWGGAWTVGLRTLTGRGELQVVRVATTAPRQKTRDGLGVGSRPRAIVRAFPRATCVTRALDRPFPGTWVVARHPNGNMTAFSIQNTTRGQPPRPPTHRVLETVVQLDWLNRPEEFPCPFGWRGW